MAKVQRLTKGQRNAIVASRKALKRDKSMETVKHFNGTKYALKTGK